MKDTTIAHVKLIACLIFLGVAVVVTSRKSIKAHAAEQMRVEVNQELDRLVLLAISLEQRLRDANTVYIGDVLSVKEMFDLTVEGRISVVESPGARFIAPGWYGTKDSDGNNPERIATLPVVVVRAWANNRFGMAFVYNGKEVHRAESPYEAAEWFVKSGL